MLTTILLLLVVALQLLIPGQAITLFDENQMEDDNQGLASQMAWAMDRHEYLAGNRGAECQCRILKVSREMPIGEVPVGEVSTVELSGYKTECGVFSSTVHQDHNTSNHESVAMTNEQTNMIDHLNVDTKVVHIKWPWLTVILQNGKYKCNGILIKKDWVLTSATCLDNDSSMEVQLSNVTYKIKSVYQHEGFDAERKRKMAGDIGLIKLAEPVPIESKRDVSPVCLPRSQTQLKQTTECAVAYMGEDEDEDQNGRIKTYSAAGKILDSTKCEKHSNIHIDGSKNMLLCIGTTKEMLTTCRKTNIMFFLCKSSGFWSIFGLSKFCNLKTSEEVIDSSANNDDESDANYSLSYFLETLKYLEWIKKKTLTRKDDLPKLNKMPKESSN